MSRVLAFMSNIKKASGTSLKSIMLRKMHVEATSILRDSYHHSSKYFSSIILQFQPISLFNRRYCSLDICVILHISMFIVFSLLISSLCS
jgi:hypothetical protein